MPLVVSEPRKKNTINMVLQRKYVLENYLKDVVDHFLWELKSCNSKNQTSGFAHEECWLLARKNFQKRASLFLHFFSAD